MSRARIRSDIERTLVAPWGGTVERTIFGTTDVDVIVGRIDAVCQATCGTPLDDGFFYNVSVGCVFGCVLTDGRRVVVKAYQPRWTVLFLEAVRRVQRHTHGSGFPCPEPIGDVVVIDGAAFVAEHELVDPGPAPVAPSAITASAQGLSALVGLCRDLDEPALADHPLRTAHDEPFPEPHSPIFDFAATSAGAEWLDELAVRASAIVQRDDAPLVIAHTDWSARNVRIVNDEVVAVYDWDSLALVKESQAIGMAAATWCKTGEPGDRTPTADDIEAYIDAYDHSRPRELRIEQRRAVRATAVYAMAYTARCEHSIDPDEQMWTTTRARLRSEADALLRAT